MAEATDTTTAGLTGAGTRYHAYWCSSDHSASTSASQLGLQEASKLRSFVLSNARDQDMAAATGGGVSPLWPSDPLALATAAEADPTGHVLVVGTPNQQQTIRTLASVAVARWPELRVAWGTAPVAALALANAAGMAARVGLSAALAVRYFDTLLSRTWSGVWVRSVAGLHEPAPTLRQHLRSWLPGGAGYLVIHRPASTVVAIGSVKGAKVMRSSLPPVREVLLVGGDAPPGVTDRVAEMAGTGTVRSVPTVVDAGQYGVAQAVEYVALPAPDATISELALPSGAECPACSLPLATPACPFCHATARMAAKGAL